jgi:4-alpha-glucanotransferase
VGPLTDPWGIEDRFHDAFGRERVTGDETRAEVLAAMGVAPGDPDAGPAQIDIRVVVAGAGDRLEMNGRRAGELRLEDGSLVTIGADGRLPVDLPFGYHALTLAGSSAATAAPIRVLASPGACFLPDDLRTWGWAVQLYAARSRDSWGLGDLADLRALGAWTRSLGGGAMMVNPLCAPAPVHPIEPSPYYPSSRRFRNPLYLRIEEIPGAADAGDEIGRLAAEARALNADRRLDRERVYRLKQQALEILWGRFAGDADFERYRAAQAPALDEFAAYCTLAERHGKDWRLWPAAFVHPNSADVRRLAAEDPRVRFHAWVQWQLDRQLEAASRDVRVFHDLPVGFDIAGADGWCWQDSLAADISIGCPPDGFNLDGQDWGLSPFIPTKLRADGYRPIVETIRAMLRHAGGLRIDHVMGLFRLFWIPRRLGNKGGTYVRYPVDELLAIIAIESHRARAVIVGEDLGTVLPGTRETLAASGMLSYRLLYFETEPPEEFLEQALSGVTTHDLATIAGIWTGAALEHARSAGVTPNEEGLTYLRNRLVALTGLPPDAPLDEVIVETHRALGRAPSRVLLATLDDALGVAEQPNMPGTTASWPNWSLALPHPLEDLRAAALPRRIAEVLRRPRAPRRAAKP